MSELHAYAYESGYQDGLRTADTEREALTQRIDELCSEVERLRKLARWAAMILTGIFPYVDYSRCTALEEVAAWKVEAYELGIEVPHA